MISKEDIGKLASLIRLRLSEEESEKITAEVDSILNYVSQINSLDISDKAKESVFTKNILREDRDPHESGVFTEKIIGQAPESELDYIKVKRIL